MYLKAGVTECQNHLNWTVNYATFDTASLLNSQLVRMGSFLLIARLQGRSQAYTNAILSYISVSIETVDSQELGQSPVI